MAREHAALTFNFILERQVLAMQAAWIEWKHGRGAEAAMEWIENTLDGPDLLPLIAETGTDAQAFFDEAIDESRRHETEALKRLEASAA